MLESLLSSTAHPPAPPSQFMVSGNGETEFMVPFGVEEISAVTIAGTLNAGGSGGGGLSWRNNIPVTGGEILILSRSNGSGSSTALKRRDGTVLVLATSSIGSTGGKGGKAAFAENDGGGNGGNGRTGGGGAGGYSGNGGIGAERSNNSQAGYGSGGGGGGGSFNRTYGGRGGGTMPYGQKADGNRGLMLGSDADINGGRGSRRPNDSERSTTYGGGGAGLACIRIIWGEGRYFPSTNTDDV